MLDSKNASSAIGKPNTIIIGRVQTSSSVMKMFRR